MKNALYLIALLIAAVSCSEDEPDPFIGEWGSVTTAGSSYIEFDLVNSGDTYELHDIITNYNLVWQQSEIVGVKKGSHVERISLHRADDESVYIHMFSLYMKEGQLMADSVITNYGGNIKTHYYASFFKVTQ